MGERGFKGKMKSTRRYTHLNKMGEKGVQRVIEHFTVQGYKCKDEQKNRKAKGYDILLRRGNKKLKIEVKTTQKEEGIPDCYVSEFDKNNKFISNFLCIVRLDKKFKLKKIELLNSTEVNKYPHTRIERVRISSTLKTDLKNGRIGKVIYRS